MSPLPLLYLIPYVIGEMFSDQQEINASKNGSSGAFTSPGYPGNYPNNANYTWSLKTGYSKATIVLNITDFSVVEYLAHPRCGDYLQIEKMDPSYKLIMKRCGNYSSIDWKDTGNMFMITFVSDDIHNSKGFKLSWRVYIPDTTTKPTTATTTDQLTTKTRTTKKTTPRTTNTLIPINKISTSTEIQTLTSGLLTSKPEQPRAQTTYPFTNDTGAYVAKEKDLRGSEVRQGNLSKMAIGSS
nr:protein SpAN-like [Crassostrea gigas]